MPHATFAGLFLFVCLLPPSPSSKLLHPQPLPLPALYTLFSASPTFLSQQLCILLFLFPPLLLLLLLRRRRRRRHLRSSSCCCCSCCTIIIIIAVIVVVVMECKCIAKSQGWCTRNISRCQVHPQHIHASYKTTVILQRQQQQQH